MALVNRNNKLYYYRSRKVGGKVVSTYVASGEAAEAARRLDEELREDKKRLRQETIAEEVRTAEIVSRLEDQCNQIKQVVEDAMAAAGYHRQNYSQWRKKRQ